MAEDKNDTVQKLPERETLEQQLREKPDETGFQASQRYIDGMLATMSTRTGRAFVFGQLSIASVDVSPFHPDPHSHAYNTGKQDSGRELKDALVLHCFELYLTMLKEAKEDKDYDDEHRNASNGND